MSSRPQYKIPIFFTGELDDILQQVFFSKTLAMFRNDISLQTMTQDVVNQVRAHLHNTGIMAKDEFDTLETTFEQKFSKILLGNVN